jgi:hypothetical protein
MHDTDVLSGTGRPATESDPAAASPESVHAHHTLLSEELPHTAKPRGQAYETDHADASSAGLTDE